MPAQPGHGIVAQHDRPMNHVGPDVPKVGDEFCGFAEVYSTEPRVPAVSVDVSMKHADFATERNLQSFSNGVRAHHRADTVIAQIVGVGHSVKLMSKDDPSVRLQSTHPARQKSDTFRSKRVRATEIIVDIAEQRASYFKNYSHRKALRCCANISARRWLPGT